MCAPLAAAVPYIAAAAAAAGTAISAKASSNQQNAASNARLQEVTRQGVVMRDNMRLQDQQRTDALDSRKKFQDNTLDAYTPDRLAQDKDTNQTAIASALAAAGDRAAAPLSADATRATGAVRVGDARSGQDSQAAGSTAYDSALADQLARAGAINTQQSGAQAAMQALSQARIQGNQRLQDSANMIQLAGARNQALNRPLSANGLLSNASSNYYGTQQQAVADTGAGSALAGQGLTTLGNIGYGAASRGMFNTPPKAIPVTNP